MSTATIIQLQPSAAHVKVLFDLLNAGVTVNINGVSSLSYNNVNNRAELLSTVPPTELNYEVTTQQLLDMITTSFPASSGKYENLQIQLRYVTSSRRSVHVRAVLNDGTIVPTCITNKSVGLVYPESSLRRSVRLSNGGGGIVQPQYVLATVTMDEVNAVLAPAAPPAPVAPQQVQEVQEQNGAAEADANESQSTDTNSNSTDNDDNNDDDTSLDDDLSFGGEEDNEHMFDDVDADDNNNMNNQNVTLPADEDDDNVNQNVTEPLVEPQQPTNVNDSNNNMNNITVNNTNNNNDTINNIDDSISATAKVQHVARGSLKRSRREDYVLVSSTPTDNDRWKRNVRRRTGEYQFASNNSVTNNSIVRVNNEQVGETTTRDAEEVDDVPTNQTNIVTLSQTLLEESKVVSSIRKTGKRVYRKTGKPLVYFTNMQAFTDETMTESRANRQARMSRIGKDSRAKVLARRRGIKAQVEVVEGAHLQDSAPIKVSNVGDATKVNNEQAPPSTPIKKEAWTKSARPKLNSSEEKKDEAAPVQVVSTSKVEKVIEVSSKKATTPSVSSAQKKMNKDKTVKKSSNVSLSKPRHFINKGKKGRKTSPLSRTSLNRSATNVIKPAASSANTTNKTPSNSNNGKQANIPDYLRTNKKPLTNARSTQKHSKKASGQTVSFKELRNRRHGKASASSQGEENVDINLVSEPVSILKKTSHPVSSVDTTTTTIEFQDDETGELVEFSYEAVDHRPSANGTNWSQHPHKEGPLTSDERADELLIIKSNWSQGHGNGDAPLVQKAVNFNPNLKCIERQSMKNFTYHYKENDKLYHYSDESMSNVRFFNINEPASIV